MFFIFIIQILYKINFSTKDKTASFKVSTAELLPLKKASGSRHIRSLSPIGGNVLLLIILYYFALTKKEWEHLGHLTLFFPVFRSSLRVAEQFVQSLKIYFSVSLLLLLLFLEVLPQKNIFVFFLILKNAAFSFSLDSIFFE